MSQPNPLGVKRKGDTSLSLFSRGLSLPAVRRAAWKLWYNLLAKGYRSKDFTFMNYGYFDDSIATLALSDDEEGDRNLIGLYHHLTKDVFFEGKDALEIGSGRGGGAAYLARSFQPRSFVGLDRSSSAVQLCRRIHQEPNLSFIEGDAEALPFENDSFDLIFNVESSHCYGNIEKFLSETYRVLRPGGHFLFCDIREKKASEHLLGLFEKSSFEIEVKRDVTQNVLKALERESERKETFIEKRTPGLLKGVMRSFAATRDSKTYTFFENGEWVYLSLRLKKPGN